MSTERAPDPPDRPGPPGPPGLRRAAPEDAEALVALHHACWCEAYTDLLGADRVAAAFADLPAHVVRRRARLADTTAATWVAERDGGLVGFASAGPARYPDAVEPFELYALYTSASQWGHGVGRALLERAVGGRAAVVSVLADNGRAVAFYRGRGFVVSGAPQEHELGWQLRMRRGPVAGGTP